MTPSWEIVARWARKEIEQARDGLESAAPDDVRALQSRIRTLRELLNMPTDPNRDPSKIIGEADSYTS
ncbi:hypothetical protein [Sphingomonas sp.]|uniref:hypothetical protein n=1 Tax=Sphingomonas sp. TaxID=28214 RepID=UPI00307D8DE6